MKKLYKNLRLHNKIQETFFLFALCLVCLLLSLFRVYLTEAKTYLFLNYNLFLASIPWMVSTLILSVPSINNKKGMQWLALASWLLFFPNAPYILTDLFHLKYTKGMPTWFDLTLILSFAWTGLVFGFISLKNIEKLFEKSISTFLSQVLVSCLLFLTAFGVYLGRFLRWNSWDILQEPMGLLYSIAHRFVYPLEHPRTWGMTLFFGLFLNLAYWSLKYMRNEQNVKQIFHRNDTFN